MLSHCFGILWNRPVRWAAVVVLFWGAGWLSIASDGTCAESIAADQPTGAARPIVYRRIYVPANDPKSWPLEHEKYIPIEAKDFEALISRSSAATSMPTAASLDLAEYTARLDDDGVLRGHGQWTGNTKPGESLFVPISKFSLTVTNARWTGSENQPVRLGLWGHDQAAPSEWGLVLPRSGTLDFDWEVRPQIQSDGLECAWHVPSATINRITFDLPDGQEPSLSGGVVLGTTQTDTDSHKSAGTNRQWKIAFPTLGNFTLKIASIASRKHKSRDQASVREITEYRIQERGLDIRLNWDVSLATAQQQELSIPLPNGVQVASVLLDGQEASWRLERGDKRSADKAVITLALAKDKRSVRIEVAAWQPLTLNEPWQLPTLHAEGVLWCAGRFDLLISSKIELRSLAPVDCGQDSIVTSKIDGENWDSRAFTAYSNAAALEINVSNPTTIADVRVTSSLALADPDVAGKLSSEWEVVQGSLYHLSGDLAPGWNIEAVETTPANALAEWSIDTLDGRRRLEIQLTHAATPTRHISVQISGRLQRSNVSETISAESLRMIRWTNANETAHLLSFQTSDPFVAEAIGNMPVVSRDQLRNNERSLVAAAENDARVVDLTQADNGAALKITVKRGQYTADVELDANYSPNEVKQTWRIAARPMSNAIDRLLIYSTAPIGDSLKWSEGISHNPVVAERVRDTDLQRKNFPKDGELWVVRLSQPTSKLIELFAACTANAQKGADIPLLSLPQALEQHGLITFRSGINDSPIVDVTGLAPVLIPAASESAASGRSTSPIRAMYRYLPTECLDTSRTPKLSIGGSDSGNGASFIVCHLKLESLLRPDGTALHCVTYDLQSRGATEFKTPLANDETIDAIFVNDKPVNTGTSSEKDRTFPVRIPLEARESVVKIYFETHQSPLRPFCMVVPPYLRTEVPALESEWNVWLPDGFEVADDRNYAFRWQERLFGPLFHSNVSSPFDPLHMFDWQLSDVKKDGLGVTNAGKLAMADDKTGNQSSSESAAEALRGTQDARAVDRSALLGKYESTFNQPGWHLSHQLFAADDVPSPRFVSRPNTINSWALGILVASYLLGRRYCGERFGLTIATIAAAASIALALPASIAPLATGALWGFVACAIVNHWKRASTRPNTTSIPVSSGVFASCLFLCVFLNAESSRAEPSPPAVSQNSTGDSSSIERLLIPIDTDRKPVDTKYFISERFIHELLQRKSASAMPDHKWLLRDASYVGDLTQSRGKSEIASGNWSLAFSVETLARDTTIQIPLVEKEAVWQAAAMLDGVPVPVEWCRDGQGCRIEVAQPGRYTLTLFCAPNHYSTNGESRVKLSIPAIVSAQVHIHTSGQPSDVKVAGATLVSQKKEEPGVFTFKLGNMDQLSVDWASIEQKSTTPSQSFSVNEMSWLRIGTEQTVLETKYIVDGNGQLPESVLIQYDARWEPLSENRSGVKVDEDSSNETQTRTLKARLIVGDNDRREAYVRWNLNKSLSAGILPIPPISLINPPATQRWLAVSSDPKLDCTLNDNGTAVATPKEFLAKWGTTSQTPQPAAVFANFDADRQWTVAVRPHEAESAIREVLHIAAGLPKTRVIYQANVSPRGVNRFGVRLSLPPKMEVDDVLLAEGDRQIETRWAKDDENHVDVFFAEVARNDYRLTLSGRVTAVANVPLDVPRVTAMQAAGTTQVQFYRDDEVKVDLKGFRDSDKANSESIELPPIQWLVRSLGTYRLDDTASRTAQLIIAPHHAELTGDNVTTITREGGSWWLTYRAHITPKSNLDVYRVRFPATCLAPFDVQANFPVTTETTTNDSGKTLAIRFNSSVNPKSAVDIRIRSQLAAPANSTFAVPNVSGIEPCMGHRYIDVPEDIDNSPVEWTTAGIQRSQLPSEFAGDNANPTKRAQFQIAKDDWHMAAAPVSTNAPQPRIPLVDTSVVVGESSGQIGHSRFVVVPGGASDCLLQLPPSEQLLSAELDGHPALLSPTEGAKWRISLDSQRLPQVLEVVWNNGSNKGVDEKRDVRRPILLSPTGPISAEISLWSVVHPTGHYRLSVEGASAVSPLDQAVLRLDRLVRTAESASSAAADAQPDGVNWFHTWAAELQTARNDVQDLIKTPNTATSIAELAPSSGEQVKQISSRLDKWLEASTDLFGNVDSSSAAPSAAEVANSVTSDVGNTDQETTRYIGEGDADRLVLKTTDESTASRRLQAMAVLAAICLGVAVTFLGRLPAIRDAVHRYPHVLGVFLGIVYWAWLWPSWLGMLIVVASVGLAMRFSWPGRSIRPESSTVLRSTRTF